MMPRLMAPATARNREPIAKVLRRHLLSRGLVLEVASGSGEHVTHFATVLSADLRFQPSDPDMGARASIDAWVQSAGVSNVLPAIALDASADRWPIQRADAVICINMIHIAPWEAAIGLVRGAAVCWPPTVCFICKDHIAATGGTRRHLMKRSMAVFAGKIKNGACGIWKQWRSWPRSTGLLDP